MTIRELRLDAGLTQRKLANLLGMSHMYICKVEGRNKCRVALYVRAKNAIETYKNTKE